MAEPKEGQPGYVFMAEWDLAGPGLLSYELGEPGALGVSYTANVDTRWDPVTLGPLLNVLTLSDHDGGIAPANANGAVLSGPMNAATEFLYVARGRPLAKVRASDLSLVGYNPNLITNPDFETNTTGWLAHGTATIERSADYAKFGTYSLKVTCPALYDGAKFAVTTAATTQYTEDCWIYSTAAVDVAINLTDNVDQGLDSANQSIPANTWTQITNTKTTDGHTSRDFKVYLNQAGPATFYIDRCRLDLRTGTALTVAEAATDIELIKNAAGTYEIAVGMDNTAFHCITTCANEGVADTAAANTPGRLARILGMAAPADTLALLGRSGAAGTTQNTVWQMALTGSVMPSTGTSTAKNTIPGANLTFTGFAIDGDAWIVGTNHGPYYSDANFDGSFRPLIPEIPLDSFNCSNMTESTFWRIVCPLSQATYALRNVYDAVPIGPETYPFNTSPVRGRMSGFAPGFRWDYANIYNPVSGDTYLCAIRPPRAGDWTAGMGVRANYYPLAKLTSTVSNFLLNIDKAAGRTMPTVVGGHGSNMFSFLLGRHDQEHDDTGYLYAASGSWYGTELRRYPAMGKRLVKAQLETKDCTATETATLKLSTVDTRGNARTETVRGAITDNGMHTLRLSPEKPVEGWRMAPQLDLARGVTATNTPKLVGKLRCWFELYELEER